METILLVSYTSLLTCWLLLTAVAQLARPARLLRLATLRLIPRWTFFAPTPIKDSYYLLYRCRRQDGSLTRWMAAPSMKRRRCYEWIWNPNGRIQHGVIDAVDHLKFELGAAEVPVRLSIPYIAVLSLVREEVDPKYYCQVQFSIMFRSSLAKNRDPQALIVSEFHQV